MKKLIVLMIAFSGILSGCIAYDAPYRDESMHRPDRDHHRDRDDGDHHRGDRDRDYDRGGDRR